MALIVRSCAVALAASSALLVASSIACSSEDPAATDPPASNDGGTQGADVAAPAVDAGDATTIPTAPYHVTGRFDGRDPAGPKIAWSGTSIRASFTGTGLSVKLRETGRDGTDWFEVSIDGQAPKAFETGPSESYEVATGLAAGTHTVVLTKRTEPLVGEAQFLGFEPKDGAIVPTPAPTGHRIEMVGDSITAGYGILGFNPCPFEAKTESEPAAWGALASAELGALHSTVAWSGMGVLRNDSGDKNNQMPVRYDRALPHDETSTWDHAKFHPELVVVNLGTNDFATGDPGAAFQAAYVAFLKDIRTKHPEAYVAVATSPMLTDSFPADEKRRTKSLAALDAIVAARKADGDTKIALLAIDEQVSSDLYGCDFHPSKDTAKKMADKLVAFAKANLGW